MNKFGNFNVDDDCNCPKQLGQVKMSLYILNDTSLNEHATKNKISNDLVEVLGYTKKQAETAIGFAANRGECLIFSGVEDITLTYMGMLKSRGIKCQARTEGMLK